MLLRSPAYSASPSAHGISNTNVHFAERLFTGETIREPDTGSIIKISGVAQQSQGRFGEISILASARFSSRLKKKKKIGERIALPIFIILSTKIPGIYIENRMQSLISVHRLRYCEILHPVITRR